MSTIIFMVDTALLHLARALQSRWFERILETFSLGRYVNLRLRAFDGRLTEEELSRRIGAASRRLRPKLLRIMAEIRLRDGQFLQAAEESLEAATEEVGFLYKMEQRAFAGLASFKAEDWVRAEDLLREVRSRLDRRTLSRIVAPRLWHYTNFFLFASLERQGRLEEGIEFLGNALRWQRGGSRGHIYLLMGQSLGQLDRICEAKAWLQRARRYKSVAEEAKRGLASLGVED